MTRNTRDGWYRELVIRFEDGLEERFFIEMTRSGTFMLAELQEPAEWTRLDFHKCTCCPLTPDILYCPAAESLENTLMRFSDHYSYENVEAIAVDGANRRTTIEGTLQEVGSVFVQLSVFSSGCPVGKRLRPLLRDMRPFATNNELTRYLISKILLRNRGNTETARKDIKNEVEPLHEVFSNLWKRLDTQPPGGDAVQNSIVRMDAFTMNVSLQLDEILNELVSDMGWEEGEEEAMPPLRRGELYEQDAGADQPPPKKPTQDPAEPAPDNSLLGRLKRFFRSS